MQGSRQILGSKERSHFLPVLSSLLCDQTQGFDAVYLSIEAALASTVLGCVNSAGIILPHRACSEGIGGIRRGIQLHKSRAYRKTNISLVSKHGSNAK